MKRSVRLKIRTRGKRTKRAAGTTPIIPTPALLHPLYPRFLSLRASRYELYTHKRLALFLQQSKKAFPSVLRPLSLPLIDPSTARSSLKLASPRSPAACGIPRADLRNETGSSLSLYRVSFARATRSRSVPQHSAAHVCCMPVREWGRKRERERERESERERGGGGDRQRNALLNWNLIVRLPRARLYYMSPRVTRAPIIRNASWISHTVRTLVALFCWMLASFILSNNLFHVSFFFKWALWGLHVDQFDKNY